MRGKLPVASRLVNGCMQGCPLRARLCRGTVRTITIFAAFARATAAVVRARNTSMTCERQGHSQDRSRVGLGPPALGSQRTLRWREEDSNHQSPVRATSSTAPGSTRAKSIRGLHRRSREAKTPAENDRGSCASLAAQCLTRPRLTRPRLANDKAAIILGLLPQKAVPTWNPDALLRR